MAKMVDTIHEEREEFMVSVTGDANPTLRIAHFLRPSITEPFPDLPSLPPSSQPTSSNLKNLIHRVQFKGWRKSNNRWKTWVHQLHTRYQSTWKQAGVYEAIMCSTYKISKHNDLIFGVAEKWCCETNTFIFPWGEATVTLEDMMVLGGYSAVGHSVLSPIEADGLNETEETLIEAFREIYRSTGLSSPTMKAWIDYFFARPECQIEHEAFLSLWLSRYVFPFKYDRVAIHVFPAAIRLARGTPVALAPAVLAGIYRDLGSLKESIVDSNKVGTGEGKNESMLFLYSPIHLVQIWGWERFPTLRPKPNLIECGEPRLARWQELKEVQVENVRSSIDSEGEYFQWRPYAKTVKSWSFPKSYRENEEWVLVNADLDNELESMARCMRVSELVGFDCIEQYLPHRVAMQFGLDQDVPGCVFRSNETPEIAWSNYSRPIKDEKLYIPARLFESDVTTRYVEWWRRSMSVQQDTIMGAGRRPRSLQSLAQNVELHKEAEDSVNEDKLTINELLQSAGKQHIVKNRPVGNVKPLLDNDHQKNVQSEALVKESEETIGDIEENGPEIAVLDTVTHSQGNEVNSGSSFVGDVEHLLGNRPVGAVEYLLDSDYQTLSSCNMSTVMNKEEELPKKCKEKNVQHETIEKESEEALIQRIRELFQLSDKRQSVENRLVGDVEPLLDSDNRTPPTCNMCTEINTEENLPMASIGRCEPLAKESKEVVESIKENNLEIAVIDIASQCPDNEVSCSHSKFEIPGLELEARISKLEKVFAGLKAAYTSPTLKLL